MTLPASCRLLRARLLAWYDRHRRDLPWRRCPENAYAQLLAELMLQQTQVATVIDYYRRFIRRFPTVAALAAADVDEVLTLWSGLGYYRRARHLHEAARRIVEDFGGRVPRTVEELMQLPGVGRYTAGAIVSVAYGVRAPVLDGNVRRVLCRLLAVDDDPRRPGVEKHLWMVAEQLVPQQRCGDFNQALMELGATLCRPGEPACTRCPWAEFCEARKQGLTTLIPPPARRPAVPEAAWTVAAVTAGRALLFVQRPPRGLWAGLWELPSEPLAAGEPPAEGLARLRNRLPGGAVIAETPLGVVRRLLTHRRVTLHVYVGRLSGRFSTSGTTRPASREHSTTSAKQGARERLSPDQENRASVPPPPARWVLPEEIDRLGISRACQAVLDLLHRKASSADRRSEG